MRRVFIDTNVLFPYSVMDLMLALTEDGVHEFVWSDRLLDEWQRVIVSRQRRTAASAERITASIREFFAEGRVPPESYAQLIDDMPSRDADDRHHIAAAVAGNADLVVTWNLRDFPAGPLAALGLGVLDPDSYLCDLFDELPDEVFAAATRVADDRRITAEALVAILTRANVPRFASAFAAALDPPD